MPIDIDQLKFLVKSAGQVPDKASQAMAAAAQAAKPAGGIPLPKELKEESPAESALSAEQQQREQEKLEQQRRQELESKENEIRGLKHELELEKVEREKMTNRYELDLRARQEEAKLRAEKEKLDKERIQLVQEKARQDNMFQAEEMRHQATLDKATYKQEADIAKAQAKSMADIARQQAQTLIATNDKARKASDKYYADATARINKEHPAISPALQSQLDGAIASLDRFKKVHSKQRVIPKPGTPPDLTKLAMIKWAVDENPTGQNTATTGATQTNPPRTAVPSTTAASNGATGAAGGRTNAVTPGVSSPATDREAWIRSMNEQVRAKARADAQEASAWDRANHGVYKGGGSYDAMRGAAYFSNQLARAKENNDQRSIAYYTNMLEQSKRMAQANYQHSERTGNKVDQALYKSYTDQRTTFNDASSHKDWMTTESQFDRDANAYADAAAQKKHVENGGGRWYQKLWDVTFGGTINGLGNSINDMRANMRNADYFGANRFWNTTFDDPAMRAAYNHAVQNHNYSDSLAGDIGNVALGLGALGLDIATIATIPFTGGASAAARAAMMAARGARAAISTTAKQGLRAGARHAAESIGRGALNVTGGLGRRALNYAKDHYILTGLNAVDIGHTAYDAYNHEAISPYTAEINPDMIKMSSAMIPIPGEAPRMVKSANVFAAQTANRYYDAHNLNNEAYYNPAYSSIGKTIGGLISSFTGGLINPYKAISPYDIYLKPRTPISGTALMNRVVTEADQKGNSNVHKVVANAAAEKHSIDEPKNTNGILRHPHYYNSLFV